MKGLIYVPYRTTLSSSLLSTCYGDYFFLKNNLRRLICIFFQMHLFDIDIPGKITFQESKTLCPGNAFTMFKTRKYHSIRSIYLLSVKLINLNFHPLEVVSRWRDSQLQVSENYSDLTKWSATLFKSCWFMSHFIFTIFKMWYCMC